MKNQKTAPTYNPDECLRRMEIYDIEGLHLLYELIREERSRYSRQDFDLLRYAYAVCLRIEQEKLSRKKHKK